MSILHLDKTVTSILAGAGIIGLALGFAFQDIAANFISGITMAAQRPIRVGELIGTNDHRHRGAHRFANHRVARPAGHTESSFRTRTSSSPCS
ncbi:MAG: mechanosensitive ion channel [Flavobacteriales bacterium]|nr:mechanosensitive ion channel [Flavobacteriales bacterium]